MARGIPSWAPFFYWSLIDVCFQLRPPESQKSSPGCSQSTIFQKIAFRNWHRFLIDFGINLAPFCLPKSIKTSLKIDPKRHQQKRSIFGSIFNRFLIAFGANLTPFCLPKSTKILSKIEPKRHQKNDRFLHRFFIDFWSILEAKLELCWRLFQPKWGGGCGIPPCFLLRCFF